jgi:rhodanese-related sulfurtransferase
MKSILKILAVSVCIVFLFSCTKDKTEPVSQPEKTSEKANQPDTPSEQIKKTIETEGDPDGKLVEGIRVIELKPEKDPVSIYVYRGDTVKLAIEEKGYPFSVHLPDFNVSKESKQGESIEVTFKAKKVGTFPLFCNGNCPAGNGAKHASIVVIQFKSTEETFYKELSAKETKERIDKGNIFILDVRTPVEYYNGHIKNAKLIPVQQLFQRISEIDDYQDKEILVYCRSGNRSTVAAEILKQHDFKKIYNLRTGIKGWIAEGYELVK